MTHTYIYIYSGSDAVLPTNDKRNERHVFEINRNEKVYQIQGNRNPFIDHPEFVAYLYTSLVKEYTDISSFEYLIG